MNFFVFGSNHNNTPLALRERMAFVAQEIPTALEQLMHDLNLHTVVILSTCNRLEFVVVTDESQAECISALSSWLGEYKQLSADIITEHFYTHANDQASKHLIAVASGIDSMVTGEPQIFGQLKSAVATSEEVIGIPGQITQFFQQIFYFAKKVRSDTAIGENPVSVAYLAVQLSRQIFSALDQHAVLLIGAGEMIELVAKHFYESGVKQIIVANRTLLHAQKIAQQFSGEAILLPEITNQLSDVDIIVSSTGSQLPILGKGSVEAALKQRRHRPFFMLDLAVPRDIEAQVANLPDVYLYTIDDLSSMTQENSKARQGEIRKADGIIAMAIQQIAQWQRSLVAVDTVKAMRGQAIEIREQELKKAKNKLQQGVPVEEVLEGLAHTLSNKLMHRPTVELKQAGIDGRKEHISWARRLFGIDDSKQ